MTTQHLSLSVAGRLALARDERERRVLVRTFVRASHGRFLAFGLVDDHAHAGLVGPRPRFLARDVRRALAAVRPDLVIEAPFLKHVDTRRYLRWLVTYLLKQSVKHGLCQCLRSRPWVGRTNWPSRQGADPGGGAGCPPRPLPGAVEPVPERNPSGDRPSRE